MFQSEL